MSLAIYDVNTFLKADTTLANIAGKTMSFYPVIGDSEETPPFVIYYATPSISSVEDWWNRYDNVRYCIYDSNVDRLLKISERFLVLLGRGDTVSESTGIQSNSSRILSSIFVDSSIEEPEEKLGWYKMDLDFQIYHVIK
jgi:hypothetical protein